MEALPHSFTQYKKASCGEQDLSPSAEYGGMRRCRAVAEVAGSVCAGCGDSSSDLGAAVNARPAGQIRIDMCVCGSGVNCLHLPV